MEEESDDAKLITATVYSMLLILLLIAFKDQIMQFTEWLVFQIQSIVNSDPGEITDAFYNLTVLRLKGRMDT